MDKPIFTDEFDWHGCEAVQFDPEKLGGRGNVEGTRMFADGILTNFDSGISPEEIADSYGVTLQAVNTILDFAALRRMKASA